MLTLRNDFLDFYEEFKETIDAFTHKDNQSSTKLLRKFNFEETAIIDEANPNLIVFRLIVS